MTWTSSKSIAGCTHPQVRYNGRQGGDPPGLGPAFRRAACLATVAAAMTMSGSMSTASLGAAAPRTIVYRCGAGHANLCAVAPRGGTPVRLTSDGRPNEDFYTSPSLDRAGTRLAFSFARRPFIATRRVTSRRPLSSDAYSDRASLRPDGRRVLVFRVAQRCPSPSGACVLGHELSIVDPSGRRLGSVDAFVHGADWAGQQRLVVVPGEERSALELRAGVGFARVRRVLTRPGSTLARPAASPDGRTIAMTVRTGEGRSFIALVRIRDGRFTALTQGPADAEPSWSPDGGSLAFVRRGRLVTMQLATRAVRELGVRAAEPTWGG